MASTRNQKTDNQISHYLLEEVLVQQAATCIFLAQDTQANKSVFLVTLQQEATKTADLAERFLRRADTLSQLQDEALLPVIDFGSDGKRPYAVLPFHSGQFLAEKMEKMPPPPEKTDQTDSITKLTLVKQIAESLRISHPAGLFHHDLRPENIFLGDDGKAYLLDLAVPSAPPISSLIEEMPAKELDYQSPEQKAGKALSGRSNIFSLGVLLYHLLAGHKPALPVSEWDIFEQNRVTREIPLSNVRPDLTQATYTAVQNSLWQKEWSRYETINDQIEAIEKAIAAESAPPPPPLPLWKKAPLFLMKPKIRKVLLPAIVLFFLLLLALMFMRGRANRQQNNAPSPEAIHRTTVVENLPAISLCNAYSSPAIAMSTCLMVKTDKALPSNLIS